MKTARLLFLFPLLLASGCSSRQSYATKLKLPPIMAPAVLAPITSPSEFDSLFSSIEAAQTPTQADTVVSGMRMTTSMAGTFGNGFKGDDTPEMIKKKTERRAEFNRFSGYVEQAAQIKRSQLENGDAKDSTGEVGILLGYARQSGANLAMMNQSIPKVSPFAAPTPMIATVPPVVQPPAARGKASEVEIQWMDDVAKTFDLMKQAQESPGRPGSQVSNGVAAERAQYNSLKVPPRFTAADALFKKSLDEMETAGSLTERGVTSNNHDLIEQAKAHLDTAQNLGNQAFDSMSATLR